MSAAGEPCNCEQALELQASLRVSEARVQQLETRVGELEAKRERVAKLEENLSIAAERDRVLCAEKDDLLGRVAELESHRNSFSCECGITYYGVECTPEERAVLDAVKSADMQEFDPDVEDPSTGDGHLYTDDQIRIVEAAWAAWPELDPRTLEES